MKPASSAPLALLAFALAFILLSPAPAHAYTDYSFTATAKVNEDGSAHVIEKVVFNLDTDSEGQTFEYYLGLSKTTLADWQRFSKNIKYHFTGSITGLKIIATREFSIRYTAAAVTIEYDLAALFTGKQLTNRVTEYDLNPDALSFSAEKGGEISLGSGTRVTMELPADALNIAIVPSPGVVWEKQDSKTSLTWTGPIAGSWAVSFDREKPLSVEVSEFFLQLYEQLTSSGVLIILLLGLLALVFLKVVKLRK